MATSPFDYVNNIVGKTGNMMRDTENDVLAEKDYAPWIVNRALSMSVDSILHANIMNSCSHLPNRAQYEFLLNSVPKKKRNAAWIKESKPSEDILLVCRHYKCNRRIASEYLKILTKSQLDEIRSCYDEGGAKR